jgi:hypothetical protein
MKKTLLLALIGLILVGFVSAQQEWGQNQNVPLQTITGTLQLRDGTIAIVNNTRIYYAPSLEWLVGFIDGLNEGTQVSVDGYVWNNYDFSYVQPAKLIVNGKSYDLQANTFAMGRHHGYRRQGRWGHGGWCH